MTGLLVILGCLTVIVPVAMAVAAYFDPRAFCTVCAALYLVGLGIALAIYWAGGPHGVAGNEFGPLAEFMIFYPIGLLFWIAGLILLARSAYLGEALGRVHVTLQAVTGVVYLGPIVFALL
jgi:hypothetical protein